MPCSHLVANLFVELYWQVLLVAKDRTKGLDLSYVTHMFLLDPVFDLATWDQLIARAYVVVPASHPFPLIHYALS